MKRNITVQGTEIVFFEKNNQDYICLTDIAKRKNPESPADIVKNWMRSHNTLVFLGTWESLYNPNFKLVEFDQFVAETWSNSFLMSPQKWIEATDAIGIVSKSGRGGWTFAHKHIAFEFASWISVDFIGQGLGRSERYAWLSEIAKMQLVSLKKILAKHTHPLLGTRVG